MKIKADANVGATKLPIMAGVKYWVNLLNAKTETKNNASNKIIKPTLFGFDFASLKLLMNKDSLITIVFF